MDKIIRYILAAFTALAVCSCKFADEAYNPYNNGTYGFAASLCQYILESSVNVMEQKVDNEEVFKDGFITVYNENYYSKIEVRKKEGADSTWVITNALTEDDKEHFYAYDFNPRHLDYTLNLKLEDNDKESEFHIWRATFEGEYDEKDGFTATMKSMNEGMKMYWKKNSWHNTVQYTLTGDGTCEVQIFRKGEPVDRTVFSYRNN